MECSSSREYRGAINLSNIKHRRLSESGVIEVYAFMDMINVDTDAASQARERAYVTELSRVRAHDESVTSKGAILHSILHHYFSAGILCIYDSLFY